MEDLEKELDESCGCCDNCNCGEECNCTPDNKCSDKCSCNCNAGNSDCAESCEQCYESNQEINVDETCEEIDLNSYVDETEGCINDDGCEEVKKDNPADFNDGVEEDKCQCGCGESVVEESTADAYFKQLLSLRAEFDNYRKRSQADVAKAYSNGFNQAITEFLPALDSFKMATEYITDSNTLIGIQYIEKGILATLEKMGIEVIDATGKFDPDFHQAIGSEVSQTHESGDIIKECFKGFKMGEKVIRYAQVIVAR